MKSQEDFMILYLLRVSGGQAESETRKALLWFCGERLLKLITHNVNLKAKFGNCYVKTDNSVKLVHCYVSKWLKKNHFVEI